MLIFQGVTYDNAREVSHIAKKIRTSGSAEKAVKLLQAAIIEWPGNVFLYNRLMQCEDDPGKAWKIFKDIQANALVPDVYTYRILINIFHLAKRQQDIVDMLDPNTMPIEALPAYCEALRKIKRYEECVRWCNIVLVSTDQKETLEQAWINRLYCYLHIDGTRFLEDISTPQLSLYSPFYYRYIAAKIYSGAYEDNEIDKMRHILEKVFKTKINEALRANIANALKLLD